MIRISKMIIIKKKKLKLINQYFKSLNRNDIYVK